MKIQVLIDNRSGQAKTGSKILVTDTNRPVQPERTFQSECTLQSEWGLSALIEFNGKKILLDTGASEKFIENASAMSLDLSSVDAGVLSHAHYDHANGMRAFFENNDRATFFLRDTAAENCYHTHRFLRFFTYQEYIGIRRGWLKRYADRIKFVNGNTEILPGVFLVGHNDDIFSAEARASIGRAVGLSVKQNGKYRPDAFNHEQSLVFDTPMGLFILNSCSHGGADNIVKEIQAAFPGKKIYAIMGGFHLFRTPDEKVREFARRLRALDVQKIYTGHCTGDHAFEILREILGERAEQIYSGKEIDL